jgi:plasmid stabilization system protein ParE
MRVRYTPRSRRDLEAIYAYIDEQSPGAARSVKRAIQHAVEILAEFPRIGTVIDRSPRVPWGTLLATILTASTIAFVAMSCGSFTSVT